MRGLFLLLVMLLAMVVGAQNKYVKQGDKLMRKFRFEQAAAQYKKAVDADANNIEAWEKLANAFTTMADYKSAEAIYQALANNTSARPVNKFYYGQVLRINGKYADAAKAYKQFATASPNDPRAAEFKNFEEDIRPLQEDNKVYEFATLPENSPASELGPAYNAGK
ncbi:MAG TPA: tetratricopeptide repeat protein, partial [Chitinophagales bacterium]|nr:tetratricopeptide repeat protein [Chitinophagales bacterium]